MSVLLFFDVSGGELLVVLLFVLLFFGSKGVPEVARTMGRALRQFRDASADVQHEMEKGISDVKKGFDEQRKAFRIEPPEHAQPQSPVRPSAGQSAAEEVKGEGEQPAPPAAPEPAPAEGAK